MIIFLFLIFIVIIMLILFIVSIVFLAIYFVYKEDNKPKNINQIQNNKPIVDKEYLKYTTNHYLMTLNELQFYRQLKLYIIQNNLNYEIFPQVDLERMIKVIDNNPSDRNKIKSRSIDFTIVSKSDCKIIFCIELDDSSHKRNDRIQRDKFINGLFNKVNIKLFRIMLKNDYTNDFNNIFKIKKEA